VLKKLGFATKIYSNKDYPKTLQMMLRTYIESGVPVILGLSNKKDKISHTTVCVGRKEIAPKKIFELAPTAHIQRSCGDSKINIYDMAEVDNDLLIMDDNFPPYRIAKASKPTKYYPDTVHDFKAWRKCKLKYLIVPLSSKTYLEYVEARNYILELLNSRIIKDSNVDSLCIRLFQVQTREYLNYVTLSEDIDEIAKDAVLELVLGKHIWVAELIPEALVKNSQSLGIIILDSTEARIDMNSALRFFAFNEKKAEIDHKSGDMYIFTLPLQPFKIYQGTLNKI
jgi:hypothetical protein